MIYGYIVLSIIVFQHATCATHKYSTMRAVKATDSPIFADEALKKTAVARNAQEYAGQSYEEEEKSINPLEYLDSVTLTVPLLQKAAAALWSKLLETKVSIESIADIPASKFDAIKKTIDSILEQTTQITEELDSLSDETSVESANRMQEMLTKLKSAFEIQDELFKGLNNGNIQLSSNLPQINPTENEWKDEEIPSADLEAPVHELQEVVPLSENTLSELWEENSDPNKEIDDSEQPEAGLPNKPGSGILEYNDVDNFNSFVELEAETHNDTKVENVPATEEDEDENDTGDTETETPKDDESTDNPGDTGENGSEDDDTTASTEAPDESDPESSHASHVLSLRCVVAFIVLLSILH